MNKIIIKDMVTVKFKVITVRGIGVSTDRVCVEASLPCEVVLRLDCVACRDDCEADRRHLHVQSISFWAPANIGPYSQAVSVSLLSWNSTGPTQTPTLGMRLSCNFVNVYMIAYRVQYTCTRENP